MLLLRLLLDVPVRKNQFGRMTPERSRQHLGALDADIDAAMLDSRNGALGNTGNV